MAFPFLMHTLLIKRHDLGIFVTSVLCLLLNGKFCLGVESDINCLKSLKDSLEDPSGRLSSWNFSNNTEAFICNFRGIECWHTYESKVLSIKLSGLGLKGQFPRGVANCTSLTGLDLSSNKLNGPLPTDIDRIIGFLTSLDLSSNSFSGQIPFNLSNCTYLNVLKLDNNQFSGTIPPKLGQLPRIKIFGVANNQLSGQLPQFDNFTTVTATGNPGLCGKPLALCRPSSNSKKSRSVIIVAAGVGGATFAALVLFIALFFFVRPSTKLRK